MLLLTSTSDQLQLVTSAAASIDVHATWIDTLGATITPGRTNTHIAAAATTIAVGSPASSAQRNVKTLHVRNKDVTLLCGITVQVFDGTLTLPIYNASLKPGEMLELTDMGGLQVQHV
jgi:hypothetical protein